MDWIVIIISLIAAFASIFTKGDRKGGQVKARPLTEEDIEDLMEEARQERSADQRPSVYAGARGAAASRSGGGVAGPARPATISAVPFPGTAAEDAREESVAEAGTARPSAGRIDRRKLVIYSEIMRPKFDDAGR